MSYTNLFNNYKSVRTLFTKQQSKFTELNDWRMSISKKRTPWVGLTSYKNKTISMSLESLYFDTNETVLDTVNHEIAHVLAPYDNRHGNEWKSKCLLTGANGERTCKGCLIPSKFILTCDSGCYQKKYDRRVKKYTSDRYHCKKCKSNLKYIDNPKYVNIKTIKKIFTKIFT